MPTAAQTTEAEWARFKPIIEMEYLTLNRSANQVQQHLKAQYNFDTTVRKLKLKFEAWKWDKKISAINYAAMNRVLQDVGQHTVFIVPKMGGRLPWRVEAKKVLKEGNRKRSNNERVGRPPPPTLDLDIAYEMLREAGIEIEHQHTAHTQQPLAPSGTLLPPNWQRPPQYPMHQPNDDDDDDDDDSTVSDESMPDADMVEVSSRELNLQNFPPELRFGQHHETPHMTEDSGQRRMAGVLPFAAAYLADLHRNIFPCIPEYKLASPSVIIARHHEGNVGVVSDPAFIPNDYTDDLGLNSTSELPTSQRLFREKLIEQTLIEYYQHYDHDGHRKVVLEFSAYYVGQVLAGHETLDDYNHVDRKDARNRLRSMLEHDNMQLLPHCYWVSSIIMSYDKIRQLLAFFEDCIDCIETSTSYLGSVLRPWIRFMVLSNRNYYNYYAAESPRLSPAALEQMDKNFNVPQKLEESMGYLSQHGHEASHTHLILRLYHAWNRCHQDQEDPRGGLIELLQCLSAAEGKFGLGHLVTVNCMSMVARAYERLNDRAVAKISVDIALSRLRPCSKMLKSRYYQLSLSSAQLLLAEGQLPEAREKLEHIVAFRRENLGVQAPMTWDAAEILFDTMSRQGFGFEAQQRRAELKAHYDEEWKRHPINYIPRH